MTHGTLTAATLPSPASIRARACYSNYAQVSVPMDVNSEGYLTNVTCYPYITMVRRNPPRAALGDHGQL